MINTVTILGSGNVANHISKRLAQNGVVVDCVFSRNVLTGSELAQNVGATFTNEIENLPQNSDAYLFMLSDSGNSLISNEINLPADSILIHTSGSLPLSIFNRKYQNCAVLYPFQTFNANVEIANYDDIPICLEATNETILHEVELLAKSISTNIYYLDYQQRSVLHLAGVFAANFMNHCVLLGQKLLHENGISMEILDPLLLQSFAKILNQGAFFSQTGPAKRGDSQIIEKHKQALEENSLLQNIYTALTESIKKTYNE